MDNVEYTIQKAADLGLKQELLQWVEENKSWDPSLYLNQEAYYTMGLKILTDSDSQKFSDSFNQGYWSTNGHDIREDGTIMANLFNNYVANYNQGNVLDEGSQSQIGQDLFVLNVLDRKRKGLFVDIGAGPPKFISNTYLLETDYEWTGVSVDLDHRNKVAWEHSGRTSKFLYESAFDVDYDKEITALLKEHNASRIDYLTVDLEPPHLTLEALYRIITSTKHRFSIITFEHDAWRDNSHILKASRELLVSHGYRLVVDNVNNQEDWWIDITY